MSATAARARIKLVVRRAAMQFILGVLLGVASRWFKPSGLAPQPMQDRWGAGVIVA
jgi:hypothetical protein